MANYLHSLRQYILRYFKKEQHEEEPINKIEAYISVLYKLLIWEDPALTAFSIIIIHMLFWVILQFELRLYGIIFLSLLIFFVLDVSLENFIKRTDQPIPLKSIRETLSVAHAVLTYLSTLRKEHPGTFCIGMCIGFVTLSIVGRTISGLLLIYIGFFILFSIPILLKSLPPDVTEHIRHTLHLISSDEGVVAETELLPTGNDDEDADSIKTDYTAESCANSFISGVTSMPSYLEAEGSVDGLDEEEFELTRNIRGITPSNLSTDSSDNEHKDIRFETAHFNRDSSSDDDNNYVQGLTFTEVDGADKPKKPVSLTQNIGTDLLSNLGAMGSSIMSSVFKSTGTAPVATHPNVKKSDSDSDFEIINTDEFQTSET